MDTIHLPLSQGKVALIDSCDRPLIAGYKWYAVKNSSANTDRWYVATMINGKAQYLHRLLMGFPPCKVDHCNRDGLDNRRANLRLATDRQNATNKPPQGQSGFRGVTFDRSNGVWIAEVYVAKRRAYRGRFFDPITAARAYDEAARRIHGDFAFLNFPELKEVA